MSFVCRVLQCFRKLSVWSRQAALISTVKSIGICFRIDRLKNSKSPMYAAGNVCARKRSSSNFVQSFSGVVTKSYFEEIKSGSANVFRYKVIENSCIILKNVFFFFVS